MADWIWITLLALTTAGAGALGYAWGRRDERDLQAEQRRLRKAARDSLLAGVTRQPPAPAAAPSSAQLVARTLETAAVGAAKVATPPLAASSVSERLGREIVDQVPAQRRQRDLAMADTDIMEDRRGKSAPFFPDTQVQEP